MATYEHSVDVQVPVRTAYDQWTQFESFPKFMDGVESITQVTPTRNHWVTEIHGQKRQFDTEITEQEPDKRIAWKAVDGEAHAGVVTFHTLADTETRVMLQMDYDPEGFVEKLGDKLGVVKRQVEGDMERFKTFIEQRGTQEGGHRGEVTQNS